jgi:hypothetical protein
MMHRAICYTYVSGERPLESRVNSRAASSHLTDAIIDEAREPRTSLKLLGILAILTKLPVHSIFSRGMRQAQALLQRLAIDSRL